MSTWYYAKDSQQFGPVNEAELKELLATGKLTSSDILVWKDGMADWVVASTLPEFQFRPPPVPAASTPAAGVVPPAPAAAPVAAASATATATGGTTQPAAETTTAAGTPESYDQADIEKNKMVAALSYVLFFFIVPLRVAPESPYARYHANQGVVLFIVSVAAWIVAAMILGALFFVPSSYLLERLLLGVVDLGVLVFMVIGIANAIQGKAKPLPFIGQFKIIS